MVFPSKNILHLPLDMKDMPLKDPPNVSDVKRCEWQRSRETQSLTRIEKLVKQMIESRVIVPLDDNGISFRRLSYVEVWHCRSLLPTN